MGDHSSADQPRSAERARVVEEAVRMASSLADRATRDVRELTRELSDVGRGDGAGSASFLMGRLLELAGSVTSFVQELQHYELVRRNPLSVVWLVAPGDPVTVVVREGAGGVGSAAFLVENDLARSLEELKFEAGPGSGDEASGGEASGGEASGGEASGGEAARGRAPIVGPDGQTCGTVRLEMADGPWVWGERRRVEARAELVAPLPGEATVTFTAVAHVADDAKEAPSPIEVIVRQERSGAVP